MAVSDSPSDEQIDAALDVINHHNPQAALAAIAQLDRAGKANDVAAFDTIARKIITVAEGLERNARAAQSQQPVAVPAPRPRDTGARRVLGVAALLFGIALWVPGAHYQLDGWTIIANAIFALIRSGIELPLATGAWALLLSRLASCTALASAATCPYAAVW